jgi:glucokinase
VSDVRVIGIDVGATNVKGVGVNPGGTILAKSSRPIASSSVPEVVRQVLSQLGSDVESVGIAAPGIASPDGRTIWWMQGRLAEIQGLDWAIHLRRSKPVPVLNDAQAALLGEAWQGAAVGCANVILLTLGTGVGGAAMVDGNLLRGHLGRAGHLGHISLDPNGPLDIVNTPGSLEDAIGECSLARRSKGRFTSTAQLLQATDEDAKRIWQTSIRALACGLASLINVLDPERVILAGGIVAAGERLFAPLHARMEELEWRPHGRAVRIVPAAAGDYAGALGAAHYAMNHQE